MLTKGRQMLPANTTLGPLDAGELAAQERGFARICELIEDSSTIALCAHTNPDGDALGSVLAMEQILHDRWPEKQVTCLLADDLPVPRIYEFLEGADRMTWASAYTEAPDLFMALDLSSLNRLVHGADVLARSKKVAVIDHHPDGDIEADASVIRPGAAAVGVIVAEFALYVGADLTPPMAQCLLCAIITDTGRFQYSNADGESFKVASMLVDNGASPSEVSLNVYQSFRLQSLHLKALVLGRIRTFEGGRIAYSYATQNDLERTGADLDECEGLIDAVRSVEGSEIALFLKVVPGGKIRGNLRSKGRHDVSSVARLMGGGGHRAAAGFTYEGDLDEALSSVLPALRELVRKDAGTCACASEPASADGKTCAQGGAL